MDLLTPSSPGGLFTLSLTSNSYWLPWGKVAIPLISPLMPLPIHLTPGPLQITNYNKCKNFHYQLEEHVS